MNHYLPEGRNHHSAPYTMEELRRAMQSSSILEAVAIKCDEFHNLHVDLGCCIGVIPREETALIDREIARICCVGKPVCFQVLALSEPPVLSRRRCQVQAQAFFLQTLTPGDILPATVSSLASFGAFCDIGCGFQALLPIEQISISRIRHARERFQEGQRIYAAVKEIDPQLGRIVLTHKELLGTWQENAAAFRAGQTVTGTVRSIKEYGIFIELLPNLSGLADPNPEIQEGDHVCVYIKSVIPEKSKLKLLILRRLQSPATPAPLTYFLTSGHLDSWSYTPHKTVTF